MTELSYFESNDILYNLKTPIPLTISEDDWDFYAENTEYGLLGLGNTEKEAVEDARANLGQIYEWKFEDELPLPFEIPEWLEKIDKLME